MDNTFWIVRNPFPNAGISYPYIGGQVYPAVLMKCLLCSQLFSSQSEAINHHLTNHVGIKSWSRTSQQSTSLTKTIFNSSEDNKLMQTLSTTPRGNRLEVILKFYCMDEMDMLYSQIGNALQMELQFLRGMKLHFFGSMASGLALKDCDLDIYMELPNHLEQSKILKNTDSKMQWALTAINGALRQSKLFKEVLLIMRARVPIVKCIHINTGCSVDINVSSHSGVYNTQFFRKLTSLDKRINETLLFLKIWAKKRSIIGKTGNMTSYCLSVLVLFYLQQPSYSRVPLPSIKLLQSQVPASVIQGANHAYNLQALALPAKLTTPDLLHGFFYFYANFDFQNYLACPYLGFAIPIANFLSDDFDFIEYKQQMQAIHSETPPKPFQIETSMRVQDPFVLNHNVARSVQAHNLMYFRLCVEETLQMFAKTSRLCLGNGSKTIYEKILLDYVEPLYHLNDKKWFKYRLVPRGGDLEATATFALTAKGSAAHSDWIDHYICAIQVLLSKVYLLNIETIKESTTTHLGHNKRWKSADNSYIWRIRGSIDTWTGRKHKRNITQAYQLKQTFDFQRQRSPQSADIIDAILIVNSVCNRTALDLSVKPAGNATEVSKTDPLQRFFNMLTISMRNFKLLEIMNMNTK